MAETAAGKLNSLIRAGRKLAAKRPKGTPSLDDLDGGVELEAICHGWFVRACGWIRQNLSQDPRFLAEFRALNKEYEWRNLLGTEFRQVRYRHEDMLKMVNHLDGLKSIINEGFKTGSTPMPLDHLHPTIRRVAQQLFVDGHYASAILEAFKAVNSRVKTYVPDSRLDGKALMGQVFRLESPAVRLTPLRSVSERDEQEGFMHLFMGAMQGIRNPKAHDEVVQTDPIRTFEYLCLASLLLRRLDDSDTSQFPPSG